MADTHVHLIQKTHEVVMKELRGEDFNHEVKVARDAMEAEKGRQQAAEARKLAGIGVSMSYAEEQLQEATTNEAIRDACAKLKDQVAGRTYADTVSKTYEMEWRTEKSEATNPSHYNSMAIQPSIYIIANDLSWCEGNIIKYVSRWRNKNGLEDLRKAQVYLGWLIEEAEGE